MYRRMYGKGVSRLPGGTPFPIERIERKEEEKEKEEEEEREEMEEKEREEKEEEERVEKEEDKKEEEEAAELPPAPAENGVDEVDVTEEGENDEDDEEEDTPTSGPLRYGPPRVRPRPADRDILLWLERCDNEEARREMEEVRRLEKEKEERARLEAERLEELKKEILLVESIDEHIDTNTEDHHTDLFECTEDDDNPQLVVRRGQEFKLTFTFQRPYDKEVDDLYLIFRTGKNPNVHKRTCAKIKLREDDRTSYMTGQKKKWGAHCEEFNGNSLTVSVYSPPNAVVGEWDYSVRTVKGKQEYDYDVGQDFVLLLNPWCEDDQVYMETTEDLNEYILNPTGAVFSGSSRKIRSRPWNYGQFQNGVLDICLDLLRIANGKKVSIQMSDPVFIARALSRILCSFEPDGVLTGRWDGKYEDGCRPLSWKGSAAILKQWKETNEEVKYGQCWVFSHLLTTVSRALGLPCRSVTNFSSAHDTNLTMTIDKYVDEEGDEVSWLNNDSVWNFHVWNEVWMHRPDLDKAFDVTGKYDGWQAVDATPQEMSEGSYQCGPSPLSAIKLGEVNVGFDTKFIFGEVNAECCDWKYTDPPTLIRRNTNRVGKYMSTKFPDGEGYKKYPGWDKPGTRLDVTDLYKAAEGSPAERAAVEAATDQGEKGDLLFGDSSGVELSLEEEPSEEIGQDFVVKVKATNTAEEARTFTLRVTVRPATYWGSLIGTSLLANHRSTEEEVLQPGEEKTFEIPVESDQYVIHCDDAITMRVLAIARVVDFPNCPAMLDEDFALSPPDIGVQGPEDPAAVGDTCTVIVTFKNPLSKAPISECVLKVDGDMYLDNEDFTLKYAVYSKAIGVLEPGEEQSVTLLARPSEKPRKSKRREVTVTLASKELPDMEGSATIFLQ